MARSVISNWVFKLCKLTELWLVVRANLGNWLRTRWQLLRADIRPRFSVSKCNNVYKLHFQLKSIRYRCWMICFCHLIRSQNLPTLEISRKITGSCRIASSGCVEIFTRMRTSSDVAFTVNFFFSDLCLI